MHFKIAINDVFYFFTLPSLHNNLIWKLPRFLLCNLLLFKQKGIARLKIWCQNLWCISFFLILYKTDYKNVDEFKKEYDLYAQLDDIVKPGQIWEPTPYDQYTFVTEIKGGDVFHC